MTEFVRPNVPLQCFTIVSRKHYCVYRLSSHHTSRLCCPDTQPSSSPHDPKSSSQSKALWSDYCLYGPQNIILESIAEHASWQPCSVALVPSRLKPVSKIWGMCVNPYVSHTATLSHYGGATVTHYFIRVEYSSSVYRVNMTPTCMYLYIRIS